MNWNNVLYFPYIRVPNSAWFTRILLYWDKVGAIIPYDYIENPERLGQYGQELVQAELLTQVVPGMYLWQVPDFSRAFLSHVDSLGPELEQRRQSFQLGGARCSVHAEKMDSLAEPLVELGLAQRGRHAWYQMETETAHDFMEYLAAVLGKLEDVQCTPVTDDGERLTHFICSGARPQRASRELQSLRCDVLDELLPAPATPLSPSDVAAFKNKHRELLPRFRRAVEKQLIEMADITDPELREYRIGLFWDETRETLDEIKARLNEAGWRDLVFGKMCSVAGAIPGVHWVAGLVGAVYAAFRKENEDIESSPLLYAAYAQEDLLKARTEIAE